MKVTCTKCGAGMPALYRKVEVLECGAKVEVIACRQCSNRLAERQIFAAPVEEPTRPLRNKAGRQRLEQGSEERPQFQYKYEPCPVVGCSRTYVKAMSKTGMCPTCHTSQRRWEKGQQTKAPRWVMTNGHRVLTKMDFLLGDTVIHTAKPQAKPVKPVKPKARKSQARKAKTTAGGNDLAELQRLAKVGNLAAKSLLDRIDDAPKTCKERP